MKTIVLHVTFLLLIPTVYGQNYEPIDLAQKIFGKESISNINDYFTREFEGKPNGKDLPEGSTTRFILLGQTGNTAVVAMTLFDSLNQGLDTYLHFEKEDFWKLSAMRSLAMTGIIERMKNELENMTSEQIQEIINKSQKNPQDEYSIFTTLEEYEFELGNAKLILELDDNLVNHFLTNELEFERLRDIALLQLKNIEPDSESNIRLIQNLKTEYEKLFVSSVSSGGYELENGINFLIGGILDNSVGYLYVKDKTDLPEMDPDRIIMLREIKNGWYIYKTT